MSAPVPYYLGPSIPDITLSGEDGAELNVGAGGTLGSAAFAKTEDFEQPDTSGSRARAWVNFSDNGATVTINKSYNIRNIDRNSDGDYTIRFQNGMIDDHYALLVTARADTRGLAGMEQFDSPVRTDSECKVATVDADFKPQVAAICSVVIFD